MLVLEPPLRKEDWMNQSSSRNGISKEPAEQTAHDAGPWEPTVREIVDFQNLGDNWDGCSAKPPSRQLLESAIGLAYVFLEKGVPPPSRVAPGLEGEVIFEWQEADGTYTDVEVVRPFFAEVMHIEPGKPARHWTLPTE